MGIDYEEDTTSKKKENGPQENSSAIVNQSISDN
jgi:hypothetical protein